MHIEKVQIIKNVGKNKSVVYNFVQSSCIMMLNTVFLCDDLIYSFCCCCCFLHEDWYYICCIICIALSVFYYFMMIVFIYLLYLLFIIHNINYIISKYVFVILFNCLSFVLLLMHWWCLTVFSFILFNIYNINYNVYKYNIYIYYLMFIIYFLLTFYDKFWYYVFLH